MLGGTLTMARGRNRPAIILHHNNGRSLKDIVLGKVPASWRQDTLAEFFSRHATIPNWEGIRGERYVYASYVDNKYEFLHDLKKDPDQLKNYAKDPEYKAILEKMRSRLNVVKNGYGPNFHKIK